MTKRLAAAILLALPMPAFALSNVFSYQGSLNDGGTPASGSYDLQFQLQSSAGVDVGAPLVREDVAVAAGLFSVELDFGAAITSADFRLQIGVRPGASTGAFTTLSPTTNLRPAPQAQIAGLATEAVTVSPNAITGASVADGSLSGVDIVDGTVSGIDIQDGEIRTADIADGTILAVDVDTTVIQARVNNGCLAGSAIRAIGQGGAVTCEAFPPGGSGTVSSVGSGAGLTGGPITTTGTLSIATGGVSSAMIADGAVSNIDLAANAVNAANVVDGSIGSADINTAQVQARVGGSCAAGSSISAIAANGAVSCEADDTGPAAWTLGGNAGTSPATQFIGTTDGQALVLRTANVASLTITPTSSGANLVAGAAANSAFPGAQGATIAGGGNAGSSNSVNDDFGTVSGGSGNRAGNTDGLTNSAPHATVAGGSFNTADAAYAAVAGGDSNDASGTRSAVIGGFFNQAIGASSAVLGGSTNCAGGATSIAAGNQARVRRGTATTSGSCSSVASSGDANGDEGTFAWADSQAADFVSSGPNQFLVRADGGVMINTSTLPASGDDLVLRARTSGDTDADIKLVTQNGTAGLLYLDEQTGSFFVAPQGLLAGQPRLNVTGGTGGVATLSNGGTWTNASSRSYKTGFRAVDPLAILQRLVALPITTWTYRGSGEGTHLGPMAEDFKAAFDLAGDGKSIATVDADGVALAAIQGLNQKLEAELAVARAENAGLQAQLQQLAARLAALESAGQR
jgi:hypothetical protein